MARTADPSAATKKAWLTRHRAQEGVGSLMMDIYYCASASASSATIVWDSAAMRWRDGEPLTTTSANRPPSKPAPKPKLKRYINVDEEE